MKIKKRVDQIEQALWQAGRSFEPLAPSPAWQEEVMAEIRRLGPLKGRAPSPAAGLAPRRTYEPATVWAWAATVAACLVIALAGLAFSNLTADQVLAGLFLDDPAGLTARELLIEL